MREINDLQIRHYKAICRRNEITKESTFINFFNDGMNKDAQLFDEAEKLNFKKITPEFIQKCIDAIATRINLLTHLNVDFIEEYKKNVIHQETRED